MDWIVDLRGCESLRAKNVKKAYTYTCKMCVLVKCLFYQYLKKLIGISGKGLEWFRLHVVDLDGNSESYQNA